MDGTNDSSIVKSANRGATKAQSALPERTLLAWGAQP
jgi:hypothetical protein